MPSSGVPLPCMMQWCTMTCRMLQCPIYDSIVQDIHQPASLGYASNVRQYFTVRQVQRMGAIAY